MLPGTTQEPLHVQSNWNEGYLTEIVFKRLRPYTIHILGLKYTTLQVLCTLADKGNLAQSLSRPKRYKCDSAKKRCKYDKILQMRQFDVDGAIKGCKRDKTVQMRQSGDPKRHKTVPMRQCDICSLLLHCRICSVWGEIATVRDFLRQQAYKAIAKLYISDLKHEQCRGEVF